MNAPVAKVLVSSFARFVQGDIKGGTHAHAYRTEVIRNAIEQAYKGNYSPITEASSLTEGKAKKSRAYAAGFAALGVIGTDLKKVEYKGALNSGDNKAARDQIASLTQHSTATFFTAFDKIMAEKAEPKGKKETAPAAGAGAGDTEAGTLGTPEQHKAASLLDSSVSGIEAALKAGALTGEQMDRIGAALVQALESSTLAAVQLAELGALIVAAETRVLLGAPVQATEVEVEQVVAEPLEA